MLEFVPQGQQLLWKKASNKLQQYSDLFEIKKTTTFK